jgi:hypothetical protein
MEVAMPNQKYRIEVDKDGEVLRVFDHATGKDAREVNAQHRAGDSLEGHELVEPKSIIFFQGDCWYSGGVWHCIR